MKHSFKLDIKPGWLAGVGCYEALSPVQGLKGYTAGRFANGEHFLIDAKGSVTRCGTLSELAAKCGELAKKEAPKSVKLATKPKPKPKAKPKAKPAASKSRQKPKRTR